MSGLSSGTNSCGGDAGRFLGGGEGDRCLKKVKIVPFFFFFFFFCGDAVAALVSGISTGISSSVEGAEEREESESAMVAGVCGLMLVVVVSSRNVERNSERSTVRHA
jgi:hypothetical protein